MIIYNVEIMFDEKLRKEVKERLYELEKLEGVISLHFLRNYMKELDLEKKRDLEERGRY